MSKVEVNISDIIAHLSDIHIRYGSRHSEYKKVFERTIEDLKEQKPRRIVVTGDLFHIKITISPNAFTLAGWFMRELSKIAPVDVILGNHDLNLQSLDQGNAVQPIIDLIPNGHMVEKDAKSLPKHEGDGHGIYFYLHSGLYNVDDEVVYGVFSCFDSETPKIGKKEKGKKYIALYHGPVYGCRGDNGYEMKGDDLMNLSTFNNFDIVMLGDIHEHQSFSTKDSIVENIAYAGSLIQQNYGESINKGYLIWNLEDSTFQRRYVPNDYGYAKLHISRGELIEERIEDLQLSNDPKKTKVSIVWQEYQENYSVEKEEQIERLIKTKYGCETVSVDCEYVSKEEEIENLGINKEVDYSDSEEFESLLREFVKNSEYDNEDEVIELAKEIDKTLNYSRKKGKKWYLNKMEVWNLYGFPEKKSSFDFDRLQGVTGIFGRNFSGKSNIIRAIVWILYRKMLGGGEPHKLVNMYTESEKAGGRVYLTIDSQKYFIERTVKVRTKKDGTPDVTYGVEYKKYTIQEDGSYEWKKVDSEKKATEKTERNNIIVESIGTFDDFTKVVLQAQNGEGNFLNMSQQPKNDLINKYLGLEIFRDRYEYAKKTFNDIKAKQKLLGDPKQYEADIKAQEKSIEENQKLITSFEKEREGVEKEVDGYGKKIIELTKSLIKVEETKYSTVEEANSAISKLKGENDTRKSQISSLEKWLSKNHKKEVPENSGKLPAILESELKSKRAIFDKQKTNYVQQEKWIKDNPKRKEIELEPLENSKKTIEDALSKLKDKLEVSKGKKCPTCNHVEHKPDPELQKKCEKDIKRGEEALGNKSKEISNAKDIQKTNLDYDKKNVELGSLKNSLTSLKNEIDNLKKDLESSKKAASIKAHNKLVEDNSTSLEKARKKMLEDDAEIEKLEKEIKVIESNKSSIDKNNQINKDIKQNEFEKKGCKLRVNQLNEKISESKSAISVSNNNIETTKEKLETIRAAEKAYGKYAIFLQAVHRDGVPARIIRNKLPIINYKINSILKNLVDFKIELYIKPNGDIKEVFYFNSILKDALPMSMASGSQKFIGSVAIRDSLHFVSSLTKPSLCIIDEGFGALDEELTIAMQSVFEYLKDKYKNTWIITHKNEIKDFVDNIIQVSKSQKGLTADQVEENPKAGVSNFDIKY